MTLHFSRFVWYRTILNSRILFPDLRTFVLDVERNLGVIKQNLRKVDRIYTIQQDLKLIMQSSNRNKFELRSLISFIRHNRLKYIYFKSWWIIYFIFYKETCNLVETSNRSVPRKKKGFFCVSFFHHYISKKMVKTIKNIKSTNKHIFWLTFDTI